MCYLTNFRKCSMPGRPNPIPKNWKWQQNRKVTFQSCWVGNRRMQQHFCPIKGNKHHGIKCHALCNSNFVEVFKLNYCYCYCLCRCVFVCFVLFCQKVLAKKETEKRWALKIYLFSFQSVIISKHLKKNKKKTIHL